MQVIVYLGNRNAVDTINGERIPVDGKQCTVVQPPPDIPLAELVKTITDPQGIWAAHSDGNPAWVAVSCDDASYGRALTAVLAVHFGGIEVREANPASSAATDTAEEV